MHFRSLFFIVVLLFSCKKNEQYPVEIIGHAGNGLSISSSIYHANSLEAIELALGTIGVDAVEIDVQLSKDKELWLLHDNLLESETTGNGCVSELTFEDLKSVRYKTIHKEKLVRLKDINFDLFKGKTIYLDVRHYNGCNFTLLDFSDVNNALNDALSKWSETNFAIVTNLKDWVNLFFTAGWTTFVDIESMVEWEQLEKPNYSFDGVIIRNNSCTKEDVNLIKSKNKKVILFDIRSPKPIRKALKKQPDAIIVDDIKAALIEKS